MRRILVTGISGFVGKHFLTYLNSLEENFEVVGIVRDSSQKYLLDGINIRYELCDLKNRLRIQDILAFHRPDHLLHLASDSSVSYSWRYPVNSFQNNTNIYLNLLESVRLLGLQTRILAVGSSEQYGVVNKEEIPINETNDLNPISPYAVSRMSQELLSKVYVNGYNLDIVMTRSFNHIGVGQRDQFVLSSFAKKVAQKQQGLISEIKTGDLSIIRDFLDVRDVVRAYYKLLLQGEKGEVYNICSGKGHSLKDILEEMCMISGIAFEPKTDSSFIRPNDNPTIVGSNRKIKSCTDWSPSIEINRSITEILEDWRKRIKSE